MNALVTDASCTLRRWQIFQFRPAQGSHAVGLAKGYHAVTSNRPASVLTSNGHFFVADAVKSRPRVLTASIPDMPTALHVGGMPYWSHSRGTASTSYVQIVRHERHATRFWTDSSWLTGLLLGLQPTSAHEPAATFSAYNLHAVAAPRVQTCIFSPPRSSSVFSDYKSSVWILIIGYCKCKQEPQNDELRAYIHQHTNPISTETHKHKPICRLRGESNVKSRIFSWWLRKLILICDTILDT